MLEAFSVMTRLICKYTTNDKFNKVKVFERTIVQPGVLFTLFCTARC